MAKKKTAGPKKSLPPLDIRKVKADIKAMVEKKYAPYYARIEKLEAMIAELTTERDGLQLSLQTIVEGAVAAPTEAKTRKPRNSGGKALADDAIIAAVPQGKDSAAGRKAIAEKLGVEADAKLSAVLKRLAEAKTIHAQGDKKTRVYYR